MIKYYTKADILGKQINLNRLYEEFPILRSLRGQAEGSERYLPVLRDNSAALYCFLLTLKRPKTIFEAGTLLGYSAILAAAALKKAGSDDFRIITCEISEENAKAALSNIKESGFSDNIDLILGDASEVIKCLPGRFDVVFLDSAKSQYVSMLPDVLSHLADGGLLICDDISYHDMTGLPPEDAPHKHRTIVNNLARFTDAVANNPDLIPFMDLMDDGMLAAIYRSDVKR